MSETQNGHTGRFVFPNDVSWYGPCQKHNAFSSQSAYNEFYPEDTSHRSTDRTPPSEGGNAGSIPAERTSLTFVCSSVLLDTGILKGLKNVRHTASPQKLRRR